jgi:ribosomal protein S18 acetylase RimI-like enzyme
MSRPRFVRKARPADVPRIVDTLLAAFAEDPFVAWVVGDRGERARRRYFELALTRLTLPHDTVWMTDDAASVALWAPSESWHLSPLAQLLMVPRVARVVGLGRMKIVGAGVDRVERGRPRSPFLLLVLLGTIPDARGSGLATEVLRPGLARCDAEDRLAVLDTSVPKNVDFYRSRGFGVVRDVELPDGPKVWSLVRPNKNASPTTQPSHP